jgi:GT2 family glycosyltransferase
MRVTAIFISFNQRPYVRDALRSVLAQSYPLQIVVSDDGSSDGTADVIREELERYDGIHQVVVRLGTENRGVAVNFTEAMRLAEGDAIVLFEGDDVSAPDRVDRLVAAFNSDSSIMMLGSHYQTIDEAGQPSAQEPESFDCTPWGLEQVISRQRLHFIPGCTFAFRSVLWHRFGPLPASSYSADVPLGYRAVLSGRLMYLADPLVKYRVLPGSLSRTDYAYGYTAESVRAAHAFWARKTVGHAIAMTHDTEIARAEKLVPEASMRQLRRTVVVPVTRQAAMHSAIAERQALPALWCILRAWRQPRIWRQGLRGVLATRIPSVYFRLKRARALCMRGFGFLQRPGPEQSKLDRAKAMKRS